jgi:hypothetical protein
VWTPPPPGTEGTPSQPGLTRAEPPGHAAGTYRSVEELITKIGEFIDGWNERRHPFVWTKSAGELLAKINQKPAS